MAAKPTTKTQPCTRYLATARKHLQQIRQDLPNMIATADKMAHYLLKGGHLFAPPVNPFWPREFGGRAGGFMCLQGQANRAKDVAYFATKDPRHWNPEQDAELTKLLKGKAHLFVIGRREDLGTLADHKRFEGFTGGADPDEGFYGYDEYRPLAHFRFLETFIRGWITTGEVITACIRAEKMPKIWMSVWLEASIARNNDINRDEQTNEGEPFEYGRTTPLDFFHTNRYIPPLAAGYAAEEFLKGAESFIESLAGQVDKLQQAGQWLAQGFQNNSNLYASATGHSYPEVLELEKDNTYPIQWQPPKSSTLRVIPEQAKKNDVMLHLGYAPVHIENVNKVLKRGIRYIHTSPYGAREGMPKSDNFLYFELPWRPADAWVDIPGYSVRILPSSSTAQTLAYNAILSEMAGQLGWK